MSTPSAKTRSAVQSVALVRPIVSFGEVLWDVFPDAERLGGCAANVAHHLAQIGAPVALVSRVGRDERGARARELLAGVGVDVACVQIDDARPTGMVQVRVRDGEPRFSIVEEAAWDRIAIDDAVRKVMASARAIVFGTLAQRTRLGGETLETALGLCPPDCVRLVDINVRPPFASRETIEASLTRATVVKMNEKEAGIVSELLGETDPVRWLTQDRGVQLVALTRAEQGSVLATATEWLEHPGVPVIGGGDAVGAGDAFCAVLALGLCEGWALERLARAANRYASFVASQPGATPVATPRAVAEMLG